MSAERDELAGIYMYILNMGHGMIPRPEQGNRAADAILSAGYRKPRTIESLADLESLEIGSVVWAFDYKTRDFNAWQLFDDVDVLRAEDGALAKSAWASAAYKVERSAQELLNLSGMYAITVLREGASK